MVGGKTGAKSGASRAIQFGTNWQTADLQATINRFAGKTPHIFKTQQKTVYLNTTTKIQIVVDEVGGYFRIEDTKLPGNRRYLDLNGTVPNNKIVNGKQTGRSQAEYNEATHFTIK